MWKENKSQNNKMNKAKQLIKNWRIIIVLISILLAIVAIYPNPWTEGVAIRAVEPNSSAMIAGIKSPAPTDTPMSRERILSVNNAPVYSVSDFFKQTSELKPNVTIYITTNKNTYSLKTRPMITVEYLDEYENKTVVETILVNKTSVDNETGEETVVETEKNQTKIVSVQKTKTTVVGTQGLGITVYEAPKSNLKRGLDLQGGSRVLLKPEKKISEQDMDIVLDNMKERLNVYGITDVLVVKAGDLSGNQFFIVEIAGAVESEATDLVSKQGKFEAKISNNTVFSGGEDIKNVCMSAECAGIDPMRPCGQTAQNQWYCNFRFSIILSQESAQRQADLTKDLSVVTEGGEDYLTEKLQLFLDDAAVDELRIGADLKGRAVTDIQISGSGQGTTQQEAMTNSLASMKRLQTILVTGSLPVKLEIVKTDSISPVLGEEFTKNSVLLGLLAMTGVAIVLLVRYRKLKIALPMILTPLCEVIIIIGIAALIGWNLDLASIAAILIVIGTGVDHCIIIADEIIRGERQQQIFDWKKRIKNAFFIIMAAYSTLFVAMLPLMFAGAGLLKGFALTTILGASVGVFIVRPAFAAAIEILLKE
jgi:preprotein translocase subunit SecD